MNSHNSKKISTHIVCGRIAPNARVNILQYTKGGGNICDSLWNMAKTLFSSQILIQIIFCMVAIAKNMARKTYTCQKI